MAAIFGRLGNQIQNNTKGWMMLPHTQEEKMFVENYYLGQSPNATVKFLQKVYSESVIGHRHDVWDVHGSDGRWWVITNPTNLYSQEQFPNMDYAMTFHLGLCLRIPRTEEQQQTDVVIKPFIETLNQVGKLSDALSQSQSVDDYQSVGVRCRESLLSFVGAAQDCAKWVAEEEPKRADFRAWTEIICNVILGGGEQKERRHLLKMLFVECWTFSNWLTHSKNTSWHDAEMAKTMVEAAISMGVNTIMRYIRHVPDACPKCSSPEFFPESLVSEDAPDVLLERPVCGNCGWAGTPIVIQEIYSDKNGLITREGGDDSGECLVPDVPLYKLARPVEGF